MLVIALSALKRYYKPLKIRIAAPPCKIKPQKVMSRLREQEKTVLTVASSFVSPPLEASIL
jgi:hypothetical protein